MYRKKFIDKLRDKYQKGGTPTSTTIRPELLAYARNQPYTVNPNYTEGTIKPEDTSIKNKMYQAAMKMLNFKMSPDAVPGLPHQFVMESTGIPSLLRLPTSTTEAWKDPSAKNVFNAALDVAGVGTAGSVIKSALRPAATVAQTSGPVVNTLRTTRNVLDKAKKTKLVTKHVNTPNAPLVKKQTTPKMTKKALANMIENNPSFVSETTIAPPINLPIAQYNVDPSSIPTNVSSIADILKLQKGGMYDERIRRFHEGGDANFDINNYDSSIPLEHWQEPHHTGQNTGGNTNNPYDHSYPQNPKPEFGVHFGLDPYADYSNPLSFAKLALQGPGFGVHGTAIDDLQQRGIDKGMEVLDRGRSAIKQAGSNIRDIWEGSIGSWFQKGGVRLPGGRMTRIPGTDAVEFTGQTHNQGGIMVDPQTEVEDGETMDQVTMAKHGGKKKDYFFSSYLKRGGRSFADMHKDILRNGGDQNDIDILAKMQEKAANRNPKKIAKLGGIAKYQTGGPVISEDILNDESIYTEIDGKPYTKKEFHALLVSGDADEAVIRAAAKRATEISNARYRLKKQQEKEAETETETTEERQDLPGVPGSKDWSDAKRKQHLKMIEEGFTYDANTGTYTKPQKNKPKPAQVYKSPFANIEEEKAFQDWANTPVSEGGPGLDTKGYGWGPASQAIYDQYADDYDSYLLESQAEETTPETDPTKIDNDKDGVFADIDLDDNDPNVGAEETQADRRNARRPSDDVKWQRIYDNLQGRIDAGRTLDAEAQALYDQAVNYLGDDRMTTAQRKAEEERIAAEKQQFDELQKQAQEQGDVPREAWLAGAAQLAPAVYAMTHKQPAAEQSVYRPGFTQPIIAEEGKASELERVNYNAERATNAAEMRGINRFIETSGGGPANIINKMSAYARKQAGDMKITAAETRANIDIANREAQLEQQMELSNLQRAQQAATTNAQMIRAEAARRDQIDMFNAQARQKLKDDQEAMKYQGIGLAAQGVAGILGDVLQYKGQERLARSVGTEGVYQRDRLRNLLKQQNPEWTDEQINNFITQYNTPS